MKRKSDEAQVRARGNQKDLLFHERPECCRVALGRATIGFLPGASGAISYPFRVSQGRYLTLGFGSRFFAPGS